MSRYTNSLRTYQVTLIWNTDAFIHTERSWNETQDKLEEFGNTLQSAVMDALVDVFPVYAMDEWPAADYIDVKVEEVS